MILIVILALAMMTLLFISLQRTYGHLPAKELKKRARAGDQVAAAIFRAVSYDTSLRAVLWVLIVLSSSLVFVMTARATESWFAVIVCSLLLWFGFIWMPAQDASSVGVWLASKLAPVFEKLLQYIHPYLSRVTNFIRRHRPISLHTGLYDKSDLLDLFARQKVQSDNRVDEQTLEIVEHSLRFADKKVADVLIPMRVVKTVAANSSVGPVLMDDLHKSGFSRFPVTEDKRIVGILYIKRLIKLKGSSTVFKVMNKTVCYVHEDQPLTEALQAILKTRQQLFIVVNSFEENVGIITMEDVLEEIIGKQIVDEFDQYEDLRVVAAKVAGAEHQKHVDDEKRLGSVQNDTKVIE